jgi:hypothetical protein
MPRIVSMGKRTGEFVLGILGGLIGIPFGIFAMVFGGIDSAMGGSSTIIGLGFAAILFSVLGIIGGAFVKSKRKLGGWFMTFAAIGGFVSISLFYIVPGLLLISGGLLALLRK